MSYLKSVFLVAIFTAFGALAKPPPEIRLAHGVFKMVPIDSVGRPNPHCSIYRELVLDEAEMTRSFAVTSNRVDGMCEIFIFPDETYYRLRYSSTSCGSNTYQGERVTDAGVERITVAITELDCAMTFRLDSSNSVSKNLTAKRSSSSMSRRV